MDDVDAVHLGAGDHAVFGAHGAQLFGGVVLAGDVVLVHLAGALRVVGGTHCDLAPIHKMTTISRPMPATQMTIASDTGPMRSMPAPPGSLDALIVWM